MSTNGKRKRTRTNRFASSANDLNCDDYFRSLKKRKETANTLNDSDSDVESTVFELSNEETETQPSINLCYSESLDFIVSELKVMHERIKSLQHHNAKLEVLFKESIEEQAGSYFNHSKPVDLTEDGLPLKTLDEVNQFEEELENAEFKARMVSAM